MIISLEPYALMLIFSISFPDLIKFPYFMDTPERRVWFSDHHPRERERAWWAPLFGCVSEKLTIL
jgi:hypothetical protein